MIMRHELGVDLVGYLCGEWPQVRVSVDGVVQREITVQDCQLVQLELDLVEGTHRLDIERFGKQDHHVRLDQGCIVQDQMVRLQHLWLDGVRLPEKLLYQGVFAWQDHVEPGSTLWGPNGVWSWQFAVPMITWAMDCLERSTHPDLLVPTPINMSTMSHKIQTLRKSWSLDQ